MRTSYKYFTGVSCCMGVKCMFIKEAARVYKVSFKSDEKKVSSMFREYFRGSSRVYRGYLKKIVFKGVSLKFQGHLIGIS